MLRKMPDSTPPKPDALLTITEQLERLCSEWQRAISEVSRAGASGPGPFAQGQRDVWVQAGKQIGALIESIKAARQSGIYLTDASQQLVALIEDRHKVTMTFLNTLHRGICAAVLAPVEEAPSDEADEAG